MSPGHGSIEANQMGQNWVLTKGIFPVALETLVRVTPCTVASVWQEPGASDLAQSSLTTWAQVLCYKGTS